MLRNFDELKKQLTELAGVINLYKSESVQLKIVELVFQKTSGETTNTQSQAPVSPPPSRKPRTRKAGKSLDAVGKKTNAPRTGKLGAVGVLNRLLSEGFFKSRRKIGDIIEHCKSKLATTIKVTDMSGPLARFVRDTKLDREQNSEGQYEYFQK